MADERPPPLPMPRLISVAETMRLKAAGEWPPPDPPPSEPGVRIVPAGDGGKKPLPRRTPPTGTAAFYERLIDAEPPWEVERAARLEAEAAAKADKKDKKKDG